MEKLLTIREAAKELGMTEKEIMDLAEDGVLPAYKVGGVYLRFKKEQVENYMRRAHIVDRKKTLLQNYPLNHRIADFFYFNDFYIFAASIILIMLFYIFREF